jgi:SAM-dependent methyltransferase
MRDRLPVNEPYDGVVARAYDTWIPVDESWPDEVVYREVLREVDGTILELGCGTGRPLLRWLTEGLDVEGLDASADMLSILRRHAAERGLSPVLHHGDFVPLSLDREYGAVVCLAGSFMLVDDEDRAVDALASYLRHLHPGGLLGLSLGVPAVDTTPSFVWRLRRTGTDDAGVSYVVHEAVHDDPDTRLQTVYDRIERFDGDGRLLDTTLRRHRLRWWERDAFEAMLTDIGFTEVRSVGDGAGWVALARRPS